MVFRYGRELVQELKRGKSCTDCGHYFPECVLHWDHVPGRGPKLFNLGQADVAKQAVLDEIAKCDLVCANCHAVRTWNRNHPEAPVTWPLPTVPVPGSACVPVPGCP